jgi:peptide chain release factor 3
VLNAVFFQGLNELLDEGAVQLLRERNDYGTGLPILAAVGQLQFEVVEYRLRSEYNVETRLEPLPYTLARWVATVDDMTSCSHA